MKSRWYRFADHFGFRFYAAGPGKLQRTALALFTFGPLLAWLASLYALAVLRHAARLERHRVEDLLRQAEKRPRVPWETCPDCTEGRDAGGSICDTCDGVARVSTQSLVAILAGRIENPDPDPTIRRDQVRAAFPSLRPELITDVVTAWRTDPRPEGPN